MKKFPNHYETLNVSKDASQEEIRASYHALCRIFHPDLNPGMADGILMIEELTKSYEVLKDTNSRQDYDMKYLVAMRSKSAPRQEAVVEQLPPLPELPSSAAEQQNISEILEFKRRQRAAEELQNNKGSSLRTAAVAAIAIIGITLLGLAVPKKTLSRIQLFNLDGIVTKAEYVRPVSAPNGAAFPTETSYVSGYEVRKNDGISTLLVNNTKNDNDVYLKLISIENNKTTTVRHLFVKGKTEFKIENLSTGKYEIQYMDLAAGLVGRSIVFSMEESKNELGLSKGTNLGVNLRTAVNGVLNVENVSLDEFNSLASL